VRRMPVRRTLVVIFIVALVPAACGDDGSDGAKGTTGGSTQPTRTGAPVSLPGKVNDHGNADLSGNGASTQLQMEADDFYFGPTFVRAAPGQRVNVELENEGEANHTFTSPSLGVDQEVKAGAKAEVEVTLPATGDAVPFFCRFHVGQGMQGAFSLSVGVGSAPTGSTSVESPAPGQGGY
jgi:plastocyanin